MQITRQTIRPFFLFVVLLFFFTSCGESGKKEKAKQAEKPEEKAGIRSDTIFTQEDFSEVRLENISLAGVIPPRNNIRVIIHKYEGDYLEDSRRNFAGEAAALLERVINSVTFRSLVENDTFLETNNLTSKQIYKLIRKAHELQGLPGTDSVLDLRVNTVKWDACYTCRNPGDWCTIGADGGKSGVFNTCTKFIDDQIAGGRYSELAGHYMHEYLHLLGFSHEKYTSADPEREETVPYKIGSIVKSLVTNYGDPLKGTVKGDERFETTINGEVRLLKIYKTSMQVNPEEPLDLSKYINKKIKLKVEAHTDSEAYGAVIIR